MTEKFNCKGYVLFKQGILVPERFISIRKVTELKKWFDINIPLDVACALAVIEGSKWNKDLEAQYSVVHMVNIEGSNWFSHRKDEGYPVEHGNYSDILSKYFDERSIYYLLYLGLKNQ